MKLNRTLVKLFWTAIFILFSSVVLSQTVIETPRYGFSAVRKATLDKIEKTDYETRLTFTYRDKPNSFVQVLDKTCLYDPISDRKYFITRAEGLTLNKTKKIPYSGKVSYTLVFPRLKKKVKKIDFTYNGYKFYIRDIELNKTDVPDYMSKWYNNNTGVLEIAFRQYEMIYNSKVWDYMIQSDNEENETYQIEAYHETDTINLTFTLGKNSYIVSGIDTVICKRKREDCDVILPKTDMMYTALNLVPDTAILKGYIEGYKKSFNSKMNWHMTNAITLTEAEMPIQIDDEGFFCEKIPLYHPQQVRIKSAFYDGSLFLEPGNELFVWFDTTNKKYEPELMGKTARIASELAQLSDINRYDYISKKSKILSLEPDGYKEWLLGKMNTELKHLDSRADTMNYAAKTLQIKDLEIKCRYASAILNYYTHYERAYRIKNNVKSYVPVEIKYLPEDYGDFLKEDLINNSAGFVTDEFLELSKDIIKSDFIKLEEEISNKALFNYLMQSGRNLTDKEKHLYQLIIGQDSLKQLNKYRYITGLKNTKALLISKYQDEYENWVVAKGYPFYIFGQLLIKKGNNLTKGEMKLIETYTKYEQEPLVVEGRKMQDELEAVIEKFSSHTPKVKMYTNLKVVADFFVNKTCLKKGLLSDLIAAHFIAAYINETKSALTGTDFRCCMGYISDSRIAQIITEYNSAFLEDDNVEIVIRN